jgi:hypothetical protein
MLQVFRRVVLRTRAWPSLTRGFANLEKEELMRLKEQYKQNYKELYSQAKQITSEKGSPGENYDDILNDVNFI